MLISYSKDSVNLDNVVNPMPLEILTEEEILETEAINEASDANKSNIAEIMDRLVNLKIDVKKQSYVGNANIDKKLMDKMVRLMLPETTKINSDYSYTTIKRHLKNLRTLLKKDSLSLSQYLLTLETFEKYEEENKDTINPSVKSMLESINSVKEIIVLRMYPKLIKRITIFKERMEQLITLYENKMVFDEITLKATLDEMDDNINNIYDLYKKYYEKDVTLRVLYDYILDRKQTILRLVSIKNEKGI